MSEKYLYIRDYTQNILGISDIKGTIVVKYKYDAWGQIVGVYGSDVSLGYLNPFRYKGYYYDTETGMYYCKSRYYVPEWGRWLNADNSRFLDSKDINKLNLFMYCCNNPINLIDDNGNLPKWAKWLLGGTLIVASVALSIATAGLGSAIAKVLAEVLVLNSVASNVIGGAIAGAVVGAASSALMNAGVKLFVVISKNLAGIELGKRSYRWCFRSYCRCFLWCHFPKI